MSAEFIDGCSVGMACVIVVYFLVRLLDFAFVVPLNNRIKQKKSQQPPKEV